MKLTETLTQPDNTTPETENGPAPETMEALNIARMKRFTLLANARRQTQGLAEKLDRMPLSSGSRSQLENAAACLDQSPPPTEELDRLAGLLHERCRSIQQQRDPSRGKQRDETLTEAADRCLDAAISVTRLATALREWHG